MILRLTLISAAGALGALCRFGLTAMTTRLTQGGLPWGTLVVNASACLAIGLFWGLLEHRTQFGQDVRSFVFIGFLGAFSTFSTYMLETTALMQDERWGWALGNVLAHNVLGLGLTLLGLALSRNL